MKITVLLEPMNARGYRATGLAPTRLVAEGPTREEALDRLSKLVQQEFASGKLVQLEVPLPGEAPPGKSLAGIWKDHPDIDEVIQNMLEYRREVGATLVTRNCSDFAQVPGLRIEDWSKP